ncbi:MAG: hypothetical protein D3908_16045, partial [Candidatus Electrothrix sp. AUS4]|nr:hypothetical protein [Candidatus Electrothrix sp. AUS4]
YLVGVGLFLGQIRLHVEFGFGQIQGIPVFHCFSRGVNMFVEDSGIVLCTSTWTSSFSYCNNKSMSKKFRMPRSGAGCLLRKQR